MTIATAFLIVALILASPFVIVILCMVGVALIDLVVRAIGFLSQVRP